MFNPFQIAKGLYNILLQNAQIYLNSLGYHAGDADGLWGRKTHNAMNKFQEDNGLKLTAFQDFMDSHTSSLLKAIWEQATGTLTGFWACRKDKWIHPLVGGPVEDPGGGARYFGAMRDHGKRAHAGVDYIAEVGREVIAMTDGMVTGFSPDFYGGTQAVEMTNADGTVSRYGEIYAAVKVNDLVKQGQLIGRIIANNIGGGHMLHLEIYMGTARGSLSNRGNAGRSSVYDYVPLNNYRRRKDLLNPTHTRYLAVKYRPLF